MERARTVPGRNRGKKADSRERKTERTRLLWLAVNRNNYEREGQKIDFRAFIDPRGSTSTRRLLLIADRVRLVDCFDNVEDDESPIWRVLSSLLPHEAPKRKESVTL